MKLERVLVTGGTGVIGAWVVRAFVERGITPVVFVRGTTDEIGRLINGDILDRLVWAYGDLLDPLTLLRAVREHGAEQIVHLAGAKPWQIEPPWVPEPRTRQGLEQWLTATVNVLDVARLAGIPRVVFASSKAVYGEIRGRHGPPTYEPLPEDYPGPPDLLYGIGKLAAEQVGFYYAEHCGLEFAALRFSSTYGPLKRGASAANPSGIIFAAAAGQVVRVPADDERDDYVYNKDVAEGIVRAALADRLPHRTYNLGVGQGLTRVELAEAIQRALPSARFEITPPTPWTAADGPPPKYKCVLDVRRAGEDLGYAPRYWPLEHAVADFLAEAERMERGRGGAAPG